MNARHLKHLSIKNHPILKDVNFNLINPKTGEPHNIIALVGENGCGKTTILNQLFEYNESKFIINKDIDDLDVVYLRQGSLYKNAMKEVNKLIDGQNMYPTNNKKIQDSNLSTLVNYNGINITDKGAVLLEKLNDSEITEIFKANLLNDIHCSTEVSKKIDGLNHGYDISNFSSGQQEILLKLKDLKTMSNDVDLVLLDEPETSLHPRWQLEIVNLIEQLIMTAGTLPQMFIATHSEKILESIISRNDVLIIRLYKEGEVIKAELMNELDLCLPSPTFAELDYLIFHIYSFEYHDELFNYFASLVNKTKVSEIDKKIEDYFSKVYKTNAPNIIKTRVYKRDNKPQITNTLPAFIRNYFHHSNEVEKPDVVELQTSIHVMRELIKYLKERGFDQKN